MRTRLAVLLLFLCIAGAWMSWLMGTARGARFALDSISRVIPAKVELGGVQGRLWNHLYIGQASFRWAEGNVRIDGLTLRWSPWMIVARRVAIDELSASKIAVSGIGRKEKPFVFNWPEIPSYLSWLQGWIRNLRIDMISYREAQEQPFELKHIAAALTWRFGLLRADRILCTSSSGELAGNVEASFSRPFVSGYLIFNPVDTAGPLRRAEIKMKLARAEKGGMGGPLEVKLSVTPERTFHLAGRLTLLHSRLDLSHAGFREEGRKGTVEADGFVEMAAPYNGRLSFTFADLDLSRELTSLSSLSGRIVMDGNPSAYRGEFDLTNKTPGFSHGAVAGACTGSVEELNIRIDRGTFLEGSVAGSVNVIRQKGIRISTSLAARKLNPGIIAREWHGSVNGDLEGNIILADGQPPEITVKALLSKGVVLNRPLEGIIHASWRKKRLTVARLDLHGQGLDLSARGLLDERIDYTVAVSNLGFFVPGAQGSVHAAGWGRWREGRAAGTIRAEGRNISFEKVKAASMKTDVDVGIDGSVNGRTSIAGMDYGSLHLNAVSAVLQGKTEEHSLRADAKLPNGRAELSLAGGYDKGRWTGKIRAFSGSDSLQGGWSLDRAAALSVSRESLILGPLHLSGTKDERLEIAINLALRKLEGFINTRWDRIDLARTNALFPDPRVLSGRTSGSLGVEWHGGNIANITAQIGASGAVSAAGVGTEIPAADATLRWNRKGLTASLEVKRAPSGRVTGRVSSDEGVRLGLPHPAQFSLLWEALDVKLVQPFLPPSFAAEGLLSGSVKGRILRDGAVDATGETHISDGLLAFRTGHGIISARLSAARADIVWRGFALKGDLEFVLADHGRVEGKFLVPLRARLPLSMDRTGPVRLSLTGSLREKGLLTALFPGLVRESHGRLDLNASASGTWEHPGLTGSLKLSDAGAFLPAAGISLKEAAARIDFTEERVNLTSFRVRSGDGKIEGKGAVRLSSLEPAEFDVSLAGADFQAVYLPELRVRISPDVQIKGKGGKVVIRGSIAIPEATLLQEEAQVVKASPDVRIVDRPVEARKPLPFAVDARIDVLLGKKITLAAEGINATLGGKIVLTGTSIHDIRAKGEIDITKGYYSTYGVRLDIERGKIIFPGGPVESGRLDILALRKISETKTGEIKPTEIKAGVLVTGPVRSPVINLYSKPNMADTDILSYIILGGPLQENASQTGLLLQAAEALLPKGQSSSLKAQLQSYLGIDTLGVETKPGQGGATQSILTVGKYLTPRLYVSMGRALLSDENLVTMKMTLSKHWELLSQTGTQSGLGLYYKVEFD